MKSSNYYKFSESLKASCDEFNIKNLSIDCYTNSKNQIEYGIILDKRIMLDYVSLKDLKIIFDVFVAEKYSIDKLYIEDVKLDKNFVEIIAKLLRNNKTISSLYLLNNNMKIELFNESLHQLSDALISTNKLTKLLIKSNSLSCDSIEIITRLLNSNNLISHVHILSCMLKDDVVMSLSDELKFNDSITYLDLSANCIENEGAIAISKMLKNNGTISSLNLDLNFVEEKGLKAILDSLRYNYVLKNFRISLAKNLVNNYELNDVFVKLIERNKKIFDHMIIKIINYLGYIVKEISDSKSDTDFKLTDFVEDKCALNKLFTNHGILTKIDEYLIGDPKSLVKDGMFQLQFCNEIDEDLSKLFGESNEIEDIF